MGHGYIGDGYGTDGGPDRDRDRARDDDRRGDWRGEPRGEWRDRDRNRGEHSPFMLEGRERDRDRNRDRDRDRGFVSRTADQARDWFREDEHDYRPSGEGRRFSGHQDDHYLNWRRQHMDALDRDYRDYCRERQQQFHQGFDSWRRNRQSAGGPQRSGGQSDELELTTALHMDGSGAGDTDASNAPQGTVDPVSTATLGTNNSENSHTDVGRRR